VISNLTLLTFAELLLLPIQSKFVQFATTRTIYITSVKQDNRTHCIFNFELCSRALGGLVLHQLGALGALHGSTSGPARARLEQPSNTQGVARCLQRKAQPLQAAAEERLGRGSAASQPSAKARAGSDDSRRLLGTTTPEESRKTMVDGELALWAQMGRSDRSQW
jgi:hypothetical protein